MTDTMMCIESCLLKSPSSEFSKIKLARDGVLLETVLGCTPMSVKVMQVEIVGNCKTFSSVQSHYE